MNTQRLSELPCPQCNAFVPISIHQLLVSNVFYCPNCGLKISIDKKSTKKMGEILQKLKKNEN